MSRRDVVVFAFGALIGAGGLFTGYAIVERNRDVNQGGYVTLEEHTETARALQDCYSKLDAR